MAVSRPESEHYLSDRLCWPELGASVASDLASLGELASSAALSGTVWD